MLCVCLGLHTYLKLSEYAVFVEKTHSKACIVNKDSECGFLLIL